MAAKGIPLLEYFNNSQYNYPISVQFSAKNNQNVHATIIFFISTKSYQIVSLNNGIKLSAWIGNYSSMNGLELVHVL